MLKRLNIILFQRCYTSVICNPKGNNLLYKQLKICFQGSTAQKKIAVINLNPPVKLRIFCLIYMVIYSLRKYKKTNKKLQNKQGQFCSFPRNTFLTKVIFFCQQKRSIRS